MWFRGGGRGVGILPHWRMCRQSGGPPLHRPGRPRLLRACLGSRVQGSPGSRAEECRSVLQDLGTQPHTCAYSPRRQSCRILACLARVGHHLIRDTLGCKSTWGLMMTFCSCPLRVISGMGPLLTGGFGRENCVAGAGRLEVARGLKEGVGPGPGQGSGEAPSQDGLLGDNT